MADVAAHDDAEVPPDGPCRVRNAAIDEHWDRLKFVCCQTAAEHPTRSHSRHESANARRGV